ncbi:hypothetical protein F5877DRAFT_72484 [Lentinula edodes]|nr:hypothetical protein F5877DRAFT_72484 [Lentinula edodes]
MSSSRYISPLRRARRDLIFYRTAYRLSQKTLHPILRKRWNDLEASMASERQAWQKCVDREHAATSEVQRHFRRLSVNCDAMWAAWDAESKAWKEKAKDLHQQVRYLKQLNKGCEDVFSQLSDLLRERISADENSSFS